MCITHSIQNKNHPTEAIIATITNTTTSCKLLIFSTITKYMQLFSLKRLHRTKKVFNFALAKQRWCHSSVGRAKDWKSLCPRFDSWWHHEESQQKDENLWISTNSEVFFLFQLCKTCRFRNFNRAKFVAFFWATEKSHDLICKAQIFTYLHSVRFIKH